MRNHLSHTVIISWLRDLAPLPLQESYDNSGLQIHPVQDECTGILVSLDIDEKTVLEAVELKCNLIITHHPLIFGKLTTINPKTRVGRCIQLCLQNGIAVYAAHTNLDNIFGGVSFMMAEKMGLTNIKVLQPRKGHILLLKVYVPVANAQALKEALWSAGAGEISNYSECSFQWAGKGTFNGNEASSPQLGEKNVREEVEEICIEVIFPQWRSAAVLQAMKAAHPYEEVAYHLIRLENEWQQAGFGAVGELPEELKKNDFLNALSVNFGVEAVRHNASMVKTVRKVALCGGAGIFLLREAEKAGADAFVTGDIKYHDFYDAPAHLLTVDIGHYESEQFTSDLLVRKLKKKFPKFAIFKAGTQSNPVIFTISDKK